MSPFCPKHLTFLIRLGVKAEPPSGFSDSISCLMPICLFSSWHTGFCDGPQTFWGMNAPTSGHLHWLSALPGVLSSQISSWVSPSPPSCLYSGVIFLWELPWRVHHKLQTLPPTILFPFLVLSYLSFLSFSPLEGKLLEGRDFRNSSHAISSTQNSALCTVGLWQIFVVNEGYGRVGWGLNRHSSVSGVL